MHLLKSIRTSPLAPEAIFAEKYDWLLKWALHFAHGDQAEAEDLVQDTFVRFVASEKELRDPDKIEPLLYTYLKFVHLSHVRRSHRFPLQEVPLFNFDSIHLAIRETPAIDPIEVQDTLRRIVAYLVWRKERAKSASVLLLRFFHGFRKDEIVRIGLLSERVVANGLMHAREETRRYLAGDLHPGGDKASSAPPHLFPTSAAVSHERLLQELLRSIFDSRQTPCLSRAELLAKYQGTNPAPIKCKLLAHIVSCEHCLQIVCERQGVAPLSGRSAEEVLGGVRRTKLGLRTKHTGDDGPRRVLRAAQQRLLELYDHQPRELRVAVNGHIVASRDVSAPHNTMEIEIARETKVEFVELVSEQGFCLLALPVMAAPPDAPPEIHQTVDLRQGRVAFMILRFTAMGPLVDISYSDPSLSATDGALDAGLEDAETDAPSPELAAVDEKRAENTPTLASELFQWLRPKRSVRIIPLMNSLLASALVLGLASVICFIFWMRQQPANISPNTFLVKAEAWDPAITKAATPGVVRQTVRIKTAHRSFDHTLYRDAQGVRIPKPPALAPGEPRWNHDLAVAHVPLEDPLSAATYQDWRASQRVRQDEIARTSAHLLTLTTTVPQGEVAQESLTVRDSDFHPVERTVRFRDSDTVEIAEVTYDVLPWQPSSEQWFEPLAVEHSLPPHRMVLPHLPRVLTEDEMDEAELSARLVLNQLGADTTERIDLVRIRAGVQVKGIVATEDRKQQIETALRTIPNVIPAIFTFQELQSGVVPSQPETSVAMSSTVAEVTPLEQGLLAQGMSREQVGEFADRLFDYSASISQASKALESLSDRFADRTLSEPARAVYAQLAASYQKQILTTLDAEETLVGQTGIQAAPSQSNSDTSLNFSQAAEKNIALCRELVRNGITQPRPAEAILSELLTSVAELRANILRSPVDGSPRESADNKPTFKSQQDK